MAWDVGDLEQGFIGGINFLQAAYMERGQLYGTIIDLMLQTGIEEIELDYTTFEDKRKEYYVSFLPADEQDKVIVKLRRKEDG